MRVLITGLTIGLLSMSSLGSPEFGDGNYLLDSCQEFEKWDRDEDYAPAELNYCLGVIKAARDGVEFYSTEESIPYYLRTCFPGRIALGPLVKIVVKFLKENPEKLHNLDTHLVMWAYWNAYPCDSNE